MKKPARQTMWFAFIFLVISSNFSQGTAQTKARSEELLRQAREALGGEGRLRSVQTLTATGNFRRVTGELNLSGQIKLEFLLPDKFMKTEITNLPRNIGQIVTLPKNRAIEK